MAYSIIFARKARKALQRIERKTSKRIMEAVEALAESPRPVGARQLKGSIEWRIRIGDYRVIYDIHDEKCLILVVKVAHRREAYRDL